MTPQQTFASKAPWIMANLMRDFSITVMDAAAITGNLGHECNGFTQLQEDKPTVKGSRGGYGWAQWTGPRRRAYEAFCKERNLRPDSDPANYMFLVHELRTTELKAIPATRAATTLRDKVEAFELAYERAGIKHYDSRELWAARALKAWDGKQEPVAPVPDVEKPDTEIPHLPPLADDDDDGLASARGLGIGIAVFVVVMLLILAVLAYHLINKGS
jgi:hypothetical protein